MDYETFREFSIFKFDFMYKKKYVGSDLAQKWNREKEVFECTTHHFIIAHNILYKITISSEATYPVGKAYITDFVVEEVFRKLKKRKRNVSNLDNIAVFKQRPIYDYIINEDDIMLTDEDYYALLIKRQLLDPDIGDIINYIHKMENKHTGNHEYVDFINMIIDNTREN